MSEYHECTTEIQDEECLIKALEELGYKPEVHKEAKNLIGYVGDKRDQKAHIIIPRKQISQASNDIGFERMSDGKYKVLISAYDQSIAKGGKRGLQIDAMKQLYTKHKLLKTVKTKLKYTLKSQEVDQDGNIRVRLTRRDF